MKINSLLNQFYGPENWENFEKFISHFANRADIEFVRPMDILKDFGIA